MRFPVLFVCSLVLIAVVSQISPAAEATLKFEVASIKRSDTRPPLDKQGYLLPPQFEFTPGGLFHATGVTVLDLLTLSHPGKNQVEGGPPWIDADRFDILARTESGVTIPSWHDAGRLQWMEMIDSLLKERFALKTHDVMRDRTVFVLTPGSAGTRLEEHTGGAEDSFQSSGGRLRFYGVSLPNFARYLSSVLHIPVVDGTGMTGLFDFTLDPYRFGPDALNGRINANDFSDLMMRAVHETGFDLQRHKATLTCTIIDNLEPPTEN